MDRITVIGFIASWGCHRSGGGGNVKALEASSRVNFGTVENLLPDDAPGASPRRCCAPVAIKLYYLDRGFSVNTVESYAPPPPTGAGMAQGGLQIFEKGFLQSLNFDQSATKFVDGFNFYFRGCLRTIHNFFKQGPVSVLPRIPGGNSKIFSVRVTV